MKKIKWCWSKLCLVPAIAGFIVFILFCWLGKGTAKTSILLEEMNRAISRAISRSA